MKSFVIMATSFVLFSIFASQSYARETCGERISEQDVPGCNYLERAGLTKDSPDFESIQSERFLKPLLKIATALSSSDDVNKVMETMRSTDSRQYFFVLESLFRLYRGFNDRVDPKHTPFSFKLIMSGFKVSKDIEDRLGDYVDGNLYLERATKLLKEDEKNILRTFALERKYRADILREYISNGEDGPWLDPSSFKNPVRVFLESARAVGKIEVQFDRNYLMDAVTAHLDKFNDRMSLKSKKHLDVSVLQGPNGLHELRRQLRWFSLNLRAVNGLVYSDEQVPNTVTEYENIKDIIDPVIVKKYGKLAMVESVPAQLRCAISDKTYLIYTKFIQDIRVIKDTGEDVEKMEQSLALEDLVASSKFRTIEEAFEAAKALQDLNWAKWRNRAPSQAAADYSEKYPQALEMVRQAERAEEARAASIAQRRDSVGLKYQSLAEGRKIFDDIRKIQLVPKTRQQLQACKASK